MIEIIDFITAESKKSKYDQLMIDFRKLRGSIPNMDRYKLGCYTAERLDTSLRIAIIYRKEEINQFFEMVALNRGIQIRVVSELRQAKTWLAIKTSI